jgi:hypothetical protein
MQEFPTMEKFHGFLQAPSRDASEYDSCLHV